MLRDDDRFASANTFRQVGSLFDAHDFYFQFLRCDVTSTIYVRSFQIASSILTRQKGLQNILLSDVINA